MSSHFIRRLAILLFIVAIKVLAQSDPLNSAYKPSVDTVCTDPQYNANVWMTDVMQKIRQDSGTANPGSACTLLIHATQGEFADFQIHTLAPAGGYTGYNVSAGNFIQTSPNTFTIPAIQTVPSTSALSEASGVFTVPSTLNPKVGTTAIIQGVTPVGYIGNCTVNTTSSTSYTCTPATGVTGLANSTVNGWSFTGNVVTHRESYLNITTVTNSGTTYYGGVTGLYPDVLVPEIDPYFGQVTSAFPVSVTAAQNQSAWVDIFVPQNAAPGYYLGSVTVQTGCSATLTGCTTIATMPVILAVWQWPAAQGSHMPASSSLQSNYQSGYQDFCAYEAYGANGTPAGCANYPPAQGNVGNGQTIGQNAGTVMFLDHRLSVTSSYTPPTVAPWLQGTNNYQWFNTIIPSAKLTFYKWNASQAIATYASQMATYNLSALGEQACDEPNLATVTGTCNPACDTAHAQSPVINCGYPVAISNFCNTASPPTAGQTCNTNTGGVIHTDTWVIAEQEQVRTPSTNPPGFSSYGDYFYMVQNWLASPGSLSGIPHKSWSYVACGTSGTCSNGITGISQFTFPMDDIDGVPANNRAQEWTIFQHGQTGELSFAVTCIWEGSGCSCPNGTDPWVSTYCFGNNGDGTLAFASTFAGTTHHVTQQNGSPLYAEIWIPSMRLKLKRDGLQDYEYLQALTTAGQGSYVTTQINSWITNLWTYETTGTGLQTARTNIGNTLHAISFPSSTGCTGSGTNWSCAAGALSSDVNGAIASASDGATITFAAGSYSFTAPINFSLVKGITVICASAPSGIGASTTAPCSISQTSDVFGIPSWGTTPPIDRQYFTKLYRVSGFTFADWPVADSPIHWGSSPSATNSGTFTNLRFDHNTFTYSTVQGSTINAINLINLGQRTYYYGVIDHNLMTCAGSCHFLFGGSAKTDPFMPPNSLGTGNNLFVEDNTITVTTESNTGEGVFDWDYGTQPFVWRHNTITNNDLTGHFPIMNYEVYNNLFIKNSGSPNADCYRVFHSQTNSLGEYFNNQAQCVSGPNSTVYSLGSIREAYRADPRTWPTGLEITGFVNHPPFTDTNRLPSQTYQGYPGFWMPTRDPATIALTPFYVWNNTAGISSQSFHNFTFGDSFCGQNPDFCSFHVVNNRDIYQATTSTAQAGPSPANCNDTSGVWFGPIAWRPTNCPTYTGETGGGFGYAAQTTPGTIGSSASGVASDAVLYQFGASGWTQIYKPYPYPHPMVAGTAQVAFPVISVAPGAYTSAQSGVTLTDTTAGATICYTVNGTAPTTNGAGSCVSPTLTYSSAFSISSTETVNAVATLSGSLDSLTLSGGYYIGATAYNAWPAQPGTYPAGTLSIGIQNPGQLTRNCVTVDGSNPAATTPGTCSSTAPPVCPATPVCVTLNGVNQFSTVVMTANTTVKFLTTGVGFVNSPITTVNYILAGTNALWWDDVGSNNFNIGGVNTAENFGNQAVNTTSGLLPIYLNSANAGQSTGSASTVATSTTVITSAAVSGTGFAIATGANTGTCGATPITIAAQGYCSMTLTFTPPSAGTFNGTLTLTDNAAGSPHVINLTGVGTGSGGVAVTPTANPSSGNAPLSVTLSTTLGSVICYNTVGSPATNGTTGCTTGTLYAGPVSVTTGETLFFVAGGTGLTDSPVGSATYGNPIVTATLTPSTVAFANEYVNSTSPIQLVTVTNTGSSTVNVSTVSISGAGFTLSGGNCGAAPFSLTAGLTCTIGSVFSPTNTISYSGTITVTDNSTTSPHTTTLSGTGVPVQVFTGTGSITGVGSVVVHP